MEIEELKGIRVDIHSVRRIVCIKHSLSWSEWLNAPDRPKADTFNEFDLFEVYRWLGY